MILAFEEEINVDPVCGWSEIGRTTKDIFPFPESNQNLRIIIGIIFGLNYGKRT